MDLPERTACIVVVVGENGQIGCLRLAHPLPNPNLTHRYSETTKSSFPVLTTTMATNIELHIKVSTNENEYIHALTISNQEITQYSIKPYKYLRFLGAIILGRRQSSGSLSDSIGGDPFGEDMYACGKLRHDKVYFTSEGNDIGIGFMGLSVTR